MWLQNYKTTGYPLRPSRPTPYSVQPPNQLVFQLCTTQYCRDSEKHEALNLKFSDILKKIHMHGLGLPLLRWVLSGFVHSELGNEGIERQL